MKFLVCLAAALVLASGCSRFEAGQQAPARTAPVSAPAKTPAAPPVPPPDKPAAVSQPAPTEVSLANPAATHCAQIGGRSEILTNVNGDSYGLCRLPDGRECEEWTLFREGRCVPQ